MDRFNGKVQLGDGTESMTESTVTGIGGGKKGILKKQESMPKGGGENESPSRRGEVRLDDEERKLIEELNVGGSKRKRSDSADSLNERATMGDSLKKGGLIRP